MFAAVYGFSVGTVVPMQGISMVMVPTASRLYCLQIAGVQLSFK